MRRVLREHGLTIVLAVIFVLLLAGQAVSGLGVYNDEQASFGLPPVSLGEYVTSSSFVVDVAENWQSEYLQFLVFIIATVWLVQRGSPESKKPGDAGIESDAEQLVGEHAREDSPRWAKERGWRLTLYSNSLALMMGVIFLLCWLVQAVAGRVDDNADRAARGQSLLSLGEYVVSADFWNRTLQNWQSEILAVASMAVLSIYLRQRGSPQSKPVGAPHDTTADAG